EDAFNELTEATQALAMQDISADKRLRQIMNMYHEKMQANKNLFLILSLESQRLRLESQKEIQAKRHAFQDLIRALIEEGVCEGVFRNVNPLLAARLLISAISPVIFGSRLTGTPQEMLTETLDIFFKGIEHC
ncbi:MAG: TetR/AcrR family transcriptional regulator C-terminal domain-containing protein, partial [Chloroflexota bacterium]